MTPSKEIPTVSSTSNEAKWKKYLPESYLTQEALELYQNGFLYLKTTPYIDYPQIVSFETLSLCNAACDFCAYPALERKGTRMRDEMIDKIINDLKDIPNSLNFHVTLARINEPFLDKRIFDVIQKVNQNLPSASIILFSNGAPLTNAMLDRLACCERIFVFSISFNDHRPEFYEKVMQIPYSRTVERLDEIHRRVANSQLKIPFRITRVGENGSADGDFIEFVKQRWPLFDVVVFRRADWLGAVTTSTSTVGNVGCNQWFAQSFLSNGNDSFCCMDSDGSFSSGANIMKEHLLDIYNRPEKKNLRKNLVSRLESSVCKGCSILA